MFTRLLNGMSCMVEHLLFVFDIDYKRITPQIRTPREISRCFLHFMLNFLLFNLDKTVTDHYTFS